MNIKQINQLAEIIKEKDLSLIEICEGDLKIHMERERSTAQTVAVAAPVQAAALPTDAQTAAAPQPEPQVDFNHIKEIKSPIVGVFYATPSPDSPPFVKIGDKVKKGDVVCIIEAMKVMNEIQSEFDGEIVDICIENGQLAEYNQTIFKLC